MKKLYVSYIQDKDNPLEDRWEVFCKAPQNWREHKSWVFSSKTFPDLDWCDDFSKERFETISLIGIVDIMEETNYPQEQINQFKEELLQENLGSFTNDW